MTRQRMKRSVSALTCNTIAHKRKLNCRNALSCNNNKNETLPSFRDSLMRSMTSDNFVDYDKLRNVMSESKDFV
jgi:hypothetical protein